MAKLPGLTDKEQIFAAAIGHKATVQRFEAGPEQATLPNQMLAGIGLELQAKDPDGFLQKHAYMGSAAVHIYWNEILGQISFVSQTDLLITYRCPELLAKKSFDDLLGRLKNTYGHRHGKLRSGF